MSTPDPPTKGRVGEAVASGGGVGGFLALAVAGMEEANPLKPFLIFLVPTISATITATWPRAFRWFSVWLPKFLQKKRLNKKLKRIIKNPTASKESKAEARQIKDDIEWAEINKLREEVLG